MKTTKRRSIMSKTIQQSPVEPTESQSLYADIYDIVRQIPRGRVTSYGAIAAYLGTRSGARLVGWAMNASHTQAPDIPAHRVVNRNGVLTGKHHFATPDLMETRLKEEGLLIIEDTIQHFDHHFWDPAIALAL
ncbi:MAG: MGMT family protein [Ferruginibacter sp.]